MTLCEITLVLAVGIREASGEVVTEPLCRPSEFFSASPSYTTSRNAPLLDVNRHSWRRNRVVLAIVVVVVAVKVVTVPATRSAELQPVQVQLLLWSYQLFILPIGKKRVQ